MQLRKSNAAVLQPDPSDALYLPPVALAIQAAETRQVADSAICRNRFEVRNIPDNLEIHTETILPVLAPSAIEVCPHSADLLGESA